MFEQSAARLLECVQEYAVIYHRLQVLELCMTAAWVLLGIAAAGAFFSFTLPRLRARRRTRH